MTSESGDEVDDYMSDLFVAKETEDIRPSLLLSHRQKVQHQSLKKKQKTDPKPKSYYQQLETDLRVEALNKPLDDSNKGFQLLTKMGFKSQSQNETNCGEKKSLFREPIKLEIKNDRKGLGSAKPVAIKFSNETIVNKELIDNKELFLAHKRSKNQSFLIEKDFKKCQKICFNLDSDANVEPKYQWFWPLVVEEEEKEKDSDNDNDIESDFEDLSVEEKLCLINEYLRSVYYYCIWCAIKFNDSADIKDNCPGNTRDKHD